jgi:hypothetical protein
LPRIERRDVAFVLVAFLSWYENTVFPKLREIDKNGVLVRDRATNHTELTPDSIEVSNGCVD